MQDILIKFSELKKKLPKQIMPKP